MLLWLVSCVFITEADIEARRAACPDRGGPFYDDDGDGFCETAPCVPRCEDGALPEPGDCDDTQAAVYPGAPEICDVLHNDCDSPYGEHDDADGDGWSVAQGDPDDREPGIVPTGVLELLSEVTCRIGRVPAGTYEVGCDEPRCAVNEGPVHEVTLTRDLLVMDAEVTRAQWDRMLGGKTWAFEDCGPSCPATHIGWYDAFRFADEINALEGLEPCAPDDHPYDCEGWRLPTESEWEIAARGRTTDAYAGSGLPGRVGWTADNSGGTVHPVRLKEPNVHGLYDMTGNVWEWTWDVYQYYGAAAVVDPVRTEGVDPAGATDRVARGGSGQSDPDHVFVTTRYDLRPDDPAYDETDAPSPVDPFNWRGFRLVRTAP